MPDASSTQSGAWPSELLTDWQAVETRVLELQLTVTRLKTQLVIQPPLLDTAIDHVLQLRRQLEDFKAEQDAAVDQFRANVQKSATWDLALLKPELSDARVQLSLLRQEKAELQSKFATLEAKQRHQQSRKGHSLVQIVELGQELTKTAAERDEATMKIKELQESANEVAQARRNLEVKLDIQCMELQQATASAREVQDSLEVSEDRVRELEDALDSMRAMWHEADEELSKLREQDGATQGGEAAETQLKELKQIQESFEVSQDRVAELEEALDNMRTMWHEADEELSQRRESDICSVCGGQPVAPSQDGVTQGGETAETQLKELKQIQESLEVSQVRVVELEEALDNMRTMWHEADEELSKRRESDICSVCGGQPVASSQDRTAQRLDAAEIQKQLESRIEAQSGELNQLQESLEVSQDRVSELEEALDNMRTMWHEADDELCKKRELDTCQMCQDRPRSVVLQPCLHYSVCGTCAEEIVECPACQTATERCDHIIFT